MKLSKIGSAASEEKSFENVNGRSDDGRKVITIAHPEQSSGEPKKVKRQCTTIILATLVDLPSPMICAKIQPQGILSSGEDF